MPADPVSDQLEHTRLGGGMTARSNAAQARHSRFPNRVYGNLR